jgi:iron complex outermembrane receptor protein
MKLLKGKLSALSGTALGAALVMGAPIQAQTTASELVASPNAGTISADTPISQTDPRTDPANAASTPDIVVTGSIIRGVPPTGSNLISVTRDDIRTIGVNSTADLLSTVPQLNSFNSAPQREGGGAGAFAPGLRGLPATATLTLLNGHRLVASGVNETTPDYPLLPELAIERVEIVADGASATYGSDAVAGVVNFITRQKANGLETSVRYGVGNNYDAFSASALYGKTWSSGSIVASYEYTENGHITGAERDYRVEDFRPYGGVDTRSTSCPAANVLVDTTAYSVYYAAPGLAPNTVNNCDNGAATDLVPRVRTHSAFVTAHQDIGSRVTLWGDILYSDRKETVEAPAPPAASGVLLIKGVNPFFQTPPGTDATTEYVLFRTDNLYGSDHIDNVFRVRAGNSSAGIDAKLFGDMKLSVYGTYDWATNDSILPAINPTALAAAANGTTSSTALDPFGNGTSPAVAAAITDFAGDLTIDQRTYLGAARLDGTLLTLPGGPLKIAVGGEYRRETFQQRGLYGGVPVPENLSRNIGSVYGELFVPIFGEGNETTLLHRLVLSVSGRYDHYSDFGSTTNPKVGLNWDPVPGLTLRGTYGTSFRAAGLRDVGATVGAYYFSAANLPAAGLYDPTRATQVDTVALYGGNRNLQPEKARTYSFGADLHPTFAPNLHASATFYDIHYTNVIATPAGSLAFTDPTFASVIFRDPSAAQLSSLLSIAVPVNFAAGSLPTIGNLLDFRQGNFGVRDTNGLDFDINYRQPTRFGAVFAGIAGNHILKFKTRLSPTSPSSNQLDLGLPRTTLRGTLGAQAGPVSLVTFVNYRAGVTNLYATPSGTASYKSGNYTTVDLRVSVKLPDVGYLKGTELAWEVNDLLNRTPPFFPATDGIGGAYNPIGRYFALNLRKAF